MTQHTEGWRLWTDLRQRLPHHPLRHMTANSIRAIRRMIYPDEGDDK